MSESRPAEALTRPCRGCAELQAIVAELAAAVSAQGRRIAALEAARPRDAADTALRVQLATSTRGLPFRAAHLIEHGIAADVPLRKAILEATIQSTEELGLWLRGARGVRDGVEIRRKGRKWLAVHVEHVTCTP